MSRTLWRRIAALSRATIRSRRSAVVIGVPPAVEGLERRRMLSTTAYLSDMAAASETNGSGPVELDMSNGLGAAGDGRALNIAGKPYAKGLGVRAGSTIVYKLGRKYDRFISAVGVDREGGRKGSVSFRVFLDGKKVYDSGKVTGGQRAKMISVSTVGKRELKLVVSDAGGGKRFDHADWANARLTSKRNLPPPIPAAPGNLAALAASPTRVDLSWADNSGNERQFRIERSTDDANFVPVGTVGANVTEFEDDGLVAGVTYYYRVFAVNAVGDSAFANSPGVALPTAVPTPTPVGGKPSTANTGPTDPALLRDSGSIDVTTDGAVIENVNVNGTITVYASNVTIRNFRVNSSGDYDIFIADGADNVTIMDGELTGSHIATLFGANFTALRLNVHHAGVDGIKVASGCVIDCCYIHDLGMDRNAHADGIQGSGGGDLTVMNNNIDMPEYTADDGQTYLSNSAVFVHTYFGPVDRVVIKDNWLNGGNYTVYSIDAGNGYGVPTDVQIENNVFGPDYKYGTLDVEG